MLLPTKRSIGLFALVLLAMTLSPVANDIRKMNTNGVGAHSNLESDRFPRELGRRADGLGRWLNAIRERDPELMPQAFESIINLGPDAAAAVPELVRVVEAPFTAIQLGLDRDDVVAEKVFDIQVRSAAIDALAAIGPGAAPATIPLIRWALTVRAIIPAEIVNERDSESILHLTGLDVEYRIKVMNAVGEFGEPALAPLTELLKSPDAEVRKFVILILGEHALPIASELLRSLDCEDGMLGLRILNEMEPFVAKAYLAELKRTLVCTANR
jgi:hypothetical protein